MEKINKCLNCNKNFKVHHKAIKYCSDECTQKANLRKRQAINIENAKKRSEKLMESGIENIDYVIDQWNGLATKRLYGIYFKNMHPEKSLNDYKKEFPNAKLTAESDKKSTSKNSGKHMKTEKYRKMFSEKFSGENNPNHSSKTTEKERKERSPFSENFIGYSDVKDKKAEVSKFAKKALKNRITETQLEYWIEKTDSIEEAKKLYQERQTTFSLEKCIERHGKERGTKIFEKRQKIWCKSLQENFLREGDGRSCSSKFANEIINQLCTSLKIKSHKKEKFIKDKETQSCYSYDFTYKKKIIEFNGDYWHCNPEIYENDYLNKRKNMFAKEIQQYDQEKIKTAEKYGYQVMVVWEKDYRENPEKVIQDCIKFLKS